MFKRLSDIFRRKRRTDGRVLFLFLAVSLTLLLIGIVLQLSSGPRHAIDETPPSSAIEPSTALPAGATNVASVKLTPAVDPTYANAYDLGGGVNVALIVWDRQQGKYVRTVTLKPDDLGLAGAQRPVVVAENPNWDGLQVFAVRAAQGAAGDRIVLLSYDGATLQVMRIIDKDGAVRPASFLIGTSATRFDGFRLEDLDGNGVQEMIVVSGTPSQGSTGTSTNAETRVFRWNGTMLTYDAQMSWAFVMSDNVFPSPTNPPKSAGATGQ